MSVHKILKKKKKNKNKNKKKKMKKKMKTMTIMEMKVKKTRKKKKRNITDNKKISIIKVQITTINLPFRHSILPNKSLYNYLKPRQTALTTKSPY